MSLKVINHYPTINSSGWIRNSPIQIYFDKPINPNSIAWDTISVNDNYSFSTVVGELGPIWASGINLSGVTSGLLFSPTIILLPNTEYSVYVYGAPNSIIGKDGSELSETYSYSFVTGTGYLDSTGSYGVPSGVSGDNDGDGTVDSEEVNTLTSGFYVVSTYPEDKAFDVATNLGQIDILFNADIYTTNLTTLSGYVDVQVTDVLN